MQPPQWDRQETFTGKNGMTGIRYAVSDRDGVTLEFSMHDETIQTMIPQQYWLPVFTSPSNSAKIDRIDGKLVVLCGFGKPNDPMGNLVLMRLSSRPGFSPQIMADAISLILVTLAGFGIQPDMNMLKAIRGN